MICSGRLQTSLWHKAVCIIEEEDHMLWEGTHYPLFRVKSFGRFVLEKLINEFLEQPPRYEAIPEDVWRSRFAACDLFKILSEPHSFCVLLTPLVPIS